MKACSINGCKRKYRCSGFCATHYNQERRVGGSLRSYSDRVIAAEKRRAFLRCLRDAEWTEERYRAFNYAQGGLCYICFDVSYQKGKPMRLCADHNHSTNKPRGLICQVCNAALWLYENIDTARAVERYLRQN